MTSFILRITTVIIIASFSGGCSLIGFSTRLKTAETVQLPFIKNSANECYYLDEFMPTPDSMVNGKSGQMSLRYYSYKAAAYKDWDDKQIVLSFYSSDDHCWSLFEEYYVDR